MKFVVHYKTVDGSEHELETTSYINVRDGFWADEAGKYVAKVSDATQRVFGRDIFAVDVVK